MVVSVDCQKTIKNKKKYKRKRVSLKNESSSFSIKRASISIFSLTYITALFIFALIVNLSDSFLYIRTPDFSLYEITLPEETVLTKKENPVVAVQGKQSHSLFKTLILLACLGVIIGLAKNKIFPSE